MLEIIKIIFIAGFGIIAYVLGWMNAIKVCKEEVLCKRQALLNISADFDTYILNEAFVLNQIKLLLEKDLNRAQLDKLFEVISKRIDNIEEVYNQRRVYFEELSKNDE